MNRKGRAKKGAWRRGRVKEREGIFSHRFLGKKKNAPHEPRKGTAPKEGVEEGGRVDRGKEKKGSFSQEKVEASNEREKSP